MSFMRLREEKVLIGGVFDDILGLYFQMSTLKCLGHLARGSGMGEEDVGETGLTANEFIYIGCGLFGVLFCIPCVLFTRFFTRAIKASSQFWNDQGGSCWKRFSDEFGTGFKVYIISLCLVAGIFAYANITAVQ